MTSMILQKLQFHGDKVYKALQKKIWGLYISETEIS